MIGLPALAVDIVMPGSGSNTMGLTPGVVYTVYDPGGATQNYPNSCTSHLILQAPAGYLISMVGEVTLAASSSGGGWGGSSGNGGDSLTIYNSSTANTASWLCGYTRSCTCLLTVGGGTAHLVFSSNSSGNDAGFALTVRLVEGPETGVSGCVDYLDFGAPGFNAYYGTFTNPSQHTGIAPGRHEIVYTDGTDPNTNNQLHRIPDGESYSIRLGNDLPGGQAERITYSYLVDTSVAPLLILKYAAVLESPNHSADRNPKFSFRLLDQQGNDINSTCYSATFIADASLGWNTCTPTGSSTSVCWKDWTTVGVDLAGVHGQTITIELTSYDCNPQNTGHYGYAYFTIGCADKTIHSTACGTFTSDTLTAPAGFTYSWHNANSPNVALSSNRSLVVTTPGTYSCYLNFIGDPSNNCQFELTALVSSVFPFARFTSDYDSTEVGAREVCFLNRSGISATNDTNDIDPTRGYSSWWDFGDGSTSTEQSPCHSFLPGEYDVTLVVHEIGRGCYDTMTTHIVISDIQLVELTDTICEGGQYLFFDTILDAEGTYTHDSTNVRTTLTLVVMPTYETNEHHDLVENQLPWLWAGISFTNSVDTLVVLHTSFGCDSAVHLSLSIFFNTQTTVDTTICTDMLPWSWNGVTFNGAARQQVVLQGAHGEDSTVVMTVSVLDSYQQDLSFRSCLSEPFVYEGTTYTQTGVYPIHYTAFNGCDSVIRLNLVIEEPPQVMITATPPYATLDNLTIRLQSTGGGAAHWAWSVDGVPLSTSRETEFRFAMDQDSMMVCLVAASASGCADTGCVIVPFYKGVAWAPNAFTPEMPTNNRFVISWNQLSEAHVWVYTRNGLLLNDFDALTGWWDGTSNGLPCPQGSYVWLMRYITFDQPRIPQVMKGTVLLIR